MSATLESEALSLPLQQRTNLVIKLLDSLEQRSVTDPRRVQRAWLEAANGRYEAYLRGEDAAITVEQCFAELEAENH